MRQPCVGCPGGADRAPRPDAKYTFVKEDLNGTSPKFYIKDGDGVEWLVKLGPEAKPETAATRFVWAMGYFTDEGLDVEINDFPGGSRALQALIGHSADVVSGAYEHTIVMQTLAQKVQAFVLQGMNPGLELGIRKDRAAAYSWAKDLKGMKIGVSAPGSSTTSPSRVKKIRRRSPPMVAATGEA